MLKRAAAAVVLAMLAVLLLPSVASARWGRSLSDPEFFGDDISVCADEITFQSEIEYTFDGYERFGGTSPVLGVTKYSDAPFAGQDIIRLFASAADALTNDPALAILTFEFDATYVRDNATGEYVFEQQITLPTPAGFSDGDVIYGVGGLGDAPFVEAFTIGEASYGCDDSAEPAELNLNVWTYQSRIWVGSWWPYVIAFDRADVDTSTLQIQADNGSVTSPYYIGDWSTRGFAKFYPNQAGVNCDSTKLILTATSTSGQPMRGEYNINPVGWSCGW